MCKVFLVFRRARVPAKHITQHNSMSLVLGSLSVHLVVSTWSSCRVLVSSRAILAFHDGYFVTSARAHQQSVLVFRRARVLSFDATAPGTSASRA